MRTTRALIALLALCLAAGCDNPQALGTKYVKTEAITAAQGGTLTILASDGSDLTGTSVVIPPNSLGGDTTITVAEGASLATMGKLPADATAAGPVADFGPSPTTFAKPVRVTLPYAIPSGGATDGLAVVAVESSGSSSTIAHEDLTVDAANGTVTFAATGFTSFGCIVAPPPATDGGAMSHDALPAPPDLRIVACPCPNVPVPNCGVTTGGAPCFCEMAISCADGGFPPPTDLAPPSCGSCVAPQTCGGGGISNVCGCTPTTCAAQNINCGTIPDGCGGAIDCGGCAAPETCGGGGISNVCGCTGSGCATASCSANSDCPPNQICGYPLADGCRATGTCIPSGSPDGGAICQSILEACGCNGTTVAVPCDFPSGYGPTPLEGLHACGAACSVDSDCPLDDACVSGQCAPFVPHVDGGSSGGPDAGVESSDAGSGQSDAAIRTCSVDSDCVGGLCVVANNCAPFCSISCLSDSECGLGSACQSISDANRSTVSACVSTSQACSGIGPVCASGQTYCGGGCVDLTGDPGNCGECGVSCPSGKACVAGACQ